MGGGGAATGGGGGGDKAEGQYGTAKTSVWWDIENCHVPRGSDPHAIAQNISSALAEMGYKGAVTVSAYGDTNKIPNAVQQALSSTGISLNHVPAGIKDASDKKILVDMLFWAVDNPPPANYLLISGDRDFSNALHQLRMRRNNILLAQPPNVSQALVAAAKSVWLWTSLVAGGPPMQNSETSYLGNALSGNTACSEAGKNTTEDSVPFSGSSSMRNEDSYGFGRADNRYKRKQAWRNQAQSTADIPRTSSNEFRQSTMGSREGYGMQLPKQLSMPMMSISETQEGTQFNHKGVGSSPFSSPQKPQREPGFSRQSEGKQFNRAPHEFFWANKPRTSDGPFIEPPHPGCPINNGNNFPNNHQTQYPQPLRLSDVPPPQPSLAPGNHIASNSHNYSSYPPLLQSNAPPFRPGPPANLPDISRLKVSEYPSGVHQNSSFPQQNPERSGGIHNLQPFCHENVHRPQPNAMDSNISSNGTWGTPRCPMSSSVVQGLMGNILRALDELKVNKMTPTEANIADCIRYGETGIQNFNVRMALDCAVENNAVVMHKLGANLPFYIGKNDRLWKCVNPLDSTVRYPEATWDAIQNFLSSTGGQSAISASECWYQAATILKKSCSEHLVLGDILQILNVTVHVKKWIIPNSYGWQPLTFTLKVASESNVDVGER